MFSKSSRLNSRIFNNIFKKGTMVFSKYFRMKYYPTDVVSVAVVIPKKILKKRIERNREKRRITHILKEIIPHDTYFSYIFWLTKDSSDFSHKELKQHIQDFLKKQK